MSTRARFDGLLFRWFVIPIASNGVSKLPWSKPRVVELALFFCEEVA
jgi:hypothetical protein